MRRAMHVDTEEVMKGTQVTHRELRVKRGIDAVEKCGSAGSKYNVINIKE
jgi:hypothetical protein